MKKSMFKLLKAIVMSLMILSFGVIFLGPIFYGSYYDLSVENLKDPSRLSEFIITIKILFILLFPAIYANLVMIYFEVGKRNKREIILQVIRAVVVTVIFYEFVNLFLFKSLGVEIFPSFIVSFLM